MSMSDPIADMLTRIRNATMAAYSTADIPSSKLKVYIAEILKEEGFIKNFKLQSDAKQNLIRVFLKYDDEGESIIGGLKRVSKPSRRVYTKSGRIPKVLNGYGISILSTSKGVMTNKSARQGKVGGEILCHVW